jgi:steroid 5-alpha reductase family enzyme
VAGEGGALEILQILAANALVLAACASLLWLVSLKTRDPSFVDAWWPLGMAALAWTTSLQAGVRGPHALVLILVCTVWAARLGIHLLWRWRSHGADRRYASLMSDARAERGWSYPKASLLLVFALQAPLQFIVCLPVQLGPVGLATDLGLLAWIGVALAAAGVVFESLGDWQLARFKADPANAGQVLATGLWRYTRHPNYFGDACVWWGLWLIAAETGWLGIAALPGPILLTFLLTRWSGVPTAESGIGDRRPDYAAYVARTSAFIPLPPRRP